MRLAFYYTFILIRMGKNDRYIRNILEQIRQVVNTLEGAAWLALLISPGECTDASSSRRISIPLSVFLFLPFAYSSIALIKLCTKERYMQTNTLSGNSRCLFFIFIFLTLKCSHKRRHTIIYIMYIYIHNSSTLILYLYDSAYFDIENLK